MAILNAFGQSFMQPDITVFKQNLASLEQLNEKWKLYCRHNAAGSSIAQSIDMLRMAYTLQLHHSQREGQLQLSRYRSLKVYGEDLDDQPKHVYNQPAGWLSHHHRQCTKYTGLRHCGTSEMLVPVDIDLENNTVPVPIPVPIERILLDPPQSWLLDSSDSMVG